MICMLIYHVPYKGVPFHKMSLPKPGFVDVAIQMVPNSFHPVPNDLATIFLACCKELLGY